MVNLVLSTKLITQVVTAYQIDSPRESGIAEIKIRNVCEKRVLVFY